MVVRSVRVRHAVSRVVTLAACACVLPLLLPRAASAAAVRDGDKPDGRAAKGTPAKAAPAKAARDANDAKKDSVATDSPVIVGSQPSSSSFFRSLAIGGGIAGAGSALLVANAGGSASAAGDAAAATPAAAAPAGTPAASDPSTGSTTGAGSTGGTSTSSTPSTGNTGSAGATTMPVTPGVAPAVVVVDPPINPTAVPEPTTVALVGAGVAALGLGARRRRGA